MSFITFVLGRYLSASWIPFRIVLLQFVNWDAFCTSCFRGPAALWIVSSHQEQPNLPRSFHLAKNFGGKPVCKESLSHNSVCQSHGISKTSNRHGLLAIVCLCIATRYFLGGLLVFFDIFFSTDHYHQDQQVAYTFWHHNSTEHRISQIGSINRRERDLSLSPAPSPAAFDLLFLEFLSRVFHLAAVGQGKVRKSHSTDRYLFCQWKLLLHLVRRQNEESI